MFFTTPPIIFGDLIIDINSYMVVCCQKPIPLTCLEFNLLVYLAQNCNRVCTFDELLTTVWAIESGQREEQLVRQTIWRLRKKFQQCHCQGQFLSIRTVRGKGFCFDSKND